MNKKIAVIGGSGRSGTYLVKALLQQGFSLRLLLRYPENFTLRNPLIEIIKGDVRDVACLELLLRDCDAVISTLNQPKGEEIPVFSQATRDIVRIMSEKAIKRYILVAGLNLDTPFDKKSPPIQQATDWMKANFPKTTADRQKEYEFLAGSDLDWTMVRLPLIVQTDERFKVEVSLEDCPGDKISTADLAAFLIEQLSDRTYIGKSPFIASV